VFGIGLVFILILCLLSVLVNFSILSAAVSIILGGITAALELILSYWQVYIGLPSNSLFKENITIKASNFTPGKKLPIILAISVIVVAIIFLLFFLNINNGHRTSYSGSSSVPVVSSPSSPTKDAASVPSAEHADDASAVVQFLTHFCTLLEANQSQEAYTQLTTASYQQENPPDSLGFADDGGVVRCIPPTQAHISFIVPGNTHCLLHFVLANYQKELNHGYYLAKQDDGTWKITTTFSMTTAENQLSPQCGNIG
jgi:hypothetical protein